MAVVKKTTTSKRGQSVSVKVSIDPRPAPTIHPPLPPVAIAPKPAPVTLLKKINKLSPAKPLKVLKQPVHEWPEEKRRRLMWWLVGGGTAVVVIGWLAVVRFELRGDQGPNLFNETVRLLKTIRWPSTKTTPSAAEQEIRQLDKEVFPQFTQ